MRVGNCFLLGLRQQAWSVRRCSRFGIWMSRPLGGKSKYFSSSRIQKGKPSSACFCSIQTTAQQSTSSQLFRFTNTLSRCRETSKRNETQTPRPSSSLSRDSCVSPPHQVRAQKQRCAIATQNRPSVSTCIDVLGQLRPPLGEIFRRAIQSREKSSTPTLVSNSNWQLCDLLLGGKRAERVGLVKSAWRRKFCFFPSKFQSCCCLPASSDSSSPASFIVGAFRFWCFCFLDCLRAFVSFRYT